MVGACASNTARTQCKCRMESNQFVHTLLARNREATSRYSPICTQHSKIGHATTSVGVRALCGLCASLVGRTVWVRDSLCKAAGAADNAGISV